MPFFKRKNWSPNWWLEQYETCPKFVPSLHPYIEPYRMYYMYIDFAWVRNNYPNIPEPEPQQCFNLKSPRRLSIYWCVYILYIHSLSLTMLKVAAQVWRFGQCQCLCSRWRRNCGQFLMCFRFFCSAMNFWCNCLVAFFVETDRHDISIISSDLNWSIESIQNL